MNKPMWQRLEEAGASLPDGGLRYAHQGIARVKEASRAVVMAQLNLDAKVEDFIEELLNDWSPAEVLASDLGSIEEVSDYLKENYADDLR